jgi:hypothetical protein
VLKLYSFVRVPDNMVDEFTKDTGLPYSKQLANHYIKAKTQLTEYYHHRQQAYTVNNTGDPIF